MAKNKKATETDEAPAAPTRTLADAMAEQLKGWASDLSGGKQWRVEGDGLCDLVAMLLAGEFTIRNLIADVAHFRADRDRYAARNAELVRETEKLQKRIGGYQDEQISRLASGDPPVGPRKADAAAAPAKPCREHDWDTSKTPPVCGTCGHVKSNRGRRSVSNPAANVTVATVDGVTKIDPPSQPLPLPPPAPPPAAPAPAKSASAKRGATVKLADGREINLDDVDKFDGGTLGGV